MVKIRRRLHYGFKLNAGVRYYLTLDRYTIIIIYTYHICTYLQFPVARYVPIFYKMIPCID
jgi:hypothetical protein